MSAVPNTRLQVSDLPPAELPELMAALVSCIPGSAWFSETHHEPGCEVEDGMFDAERGRRRADDETGETGEADAATG